LLNAPVGVRRLIARLRPDPTTTAPASRRHSRSIRAVSALRARMSGDAAGRHSVDGTPHRPFGHSVSIERVLPVAIAALVAGASLLSALPAASTGGADGPGAEVRIAVGGGLDQGRFDAPRPEGLEGRPDPGTWDGGGGAPDGNDFRPLVLPMAVDSAADPNDVAIEAAVAGPFLDDGTLLAGFAPETSVEDGSGLLQTYKVQPGDTLVTIAQRHGVSMMTLWWANKLKTKESLRIGQVLTIPPVNGLVVTVGELDTLESLAAKHKVDAVSIIELNRLEDDTLIVGQTLVLPGAKGEPIPTPTPKPTPKPKPRSTSTSTSTRTYGGGSWVWPVVGGNNYISQYFRYGHYAIDIAADYGSTVRAVTGGTVLFAGWKSNGGGYQVHISHGGGIYTTYNHMSRVSVGRGQAVGRGQTVGRIGCTGYCSGPHLHFDVWIGPIWNGGHRVNPLRYF
jgi:murein DD-endopeptidase MepM/ murein hydrolase activator NlpD